jgi:hypothetical protein
VVQGSDAAPGVPHHLGRKRNPSCLLDLGLFLPTRIYHSHLTGWLPFHFINFKKKLFSEIFVNIVLLFVQNYARKYRYPIDTVSFSFVMRDEPPEELSKPDDGVYIYGLFLEGARWDKSQCSLVDPKPKELFSPMPTIHLLPVQYRETPQSGIYRCPVYKVLTRTGTLSTTGHSTNFVTWIEIPSNQETIYRSSLVSETNAQVKFCDQSYWIKAGVACFCALRY